MTGLENLDYVTFDLKRLAAADFLGLDRLALAVVGKGDLAHPALAVHEVLADGVDGGYL